MEKIGVTGMDYHFPERVVRDITVFAQRHDVQKVILCGSRARGTHTERSDIDLAVSGGDRKGFYWDILPESAGKRCRQFCGYTVPGMRRQARPERFFSLAIGSDFGTR